MFTIKNSFKNSFWCSCYLFITIYLIIIKYMCSLTWVNTTYDELSYLVIAIGNRAQKNSCKYFSEITPLWRIFSKSE